MDMHQDSLPPFSVFIVQKITIAIHSHFNMGLIPLTPQIVLQLKGSFNESSVCKSRALTNGIKNF